MRVRSAKESRNTPTAIGSVLVCVVSGTALFIAVTAWAGLCQDGNQPSCHGGSPSFELLFQAGLAATALAVSFVSRYFVNRRAYARARAALSVGIVLLAAWALFADAATHGWDDLQVPIRVATVAVVLAPLVIVAVVLRRTR